MPSIRSVRTDKSPQPAGHYSQAVIHAGTVYVAGQLPFSPGDGSIPDGGPKEHMRQALTNVRHILEASGSGLDCLLSVTVYVTSGEVWSEVNDVFAEMLKDHRPARAIVPAGELKRGAFVEVSAIAALYP